MQVKLKNGVLECNPSKTELSFLVRGVEVMEALAAVDPIDPDLKAAATAGHNAGKAVIQFYKNKLAKG